MVGDVLPHVCIAILAEALVVKPVDLRDLAGLVVSTQNSDSLRISDLECDEQCDGLDRVVSAIDVITYNHPTQAPVSTIQSSPRNRARATPAKRAGFNMPINK